MGEIGQVVNWLIILAFIYAAYSTRNKRSKILCHFTGKDKTEETKWISVKDDCVVFRNYKFDILPDRITSFWYTGGIHFLFPTRVNFIKFSWYSRFPHDPNNYNVTVVNPRVRKIMNKSEWVESFCKTGSGTTAKKQGILEKYGVIIAIGLVLILGFYVYTTNQQFAGALGQLQNSFNSLAK